MIEPNGNQLLELETFYLPEYLNGYNFTSIPTHRLALKINTHIMLIRNVNQQEGLYNGTRLMVSQLLPTIIEATIITGTSIRKRAYIPRIKFIHKNSNLPFTFIWKEFPIKVCYAMTINKSQCQSLKKIGVYLPEPVFIHGQLYVDLSRATSPDSIKILANMDSHVTQDTTMNVVFKDLLTRVDTHEVHHTTNSHYFKCLINSFLIQNIL